MHDHFPPCQDARTPCPVSSSIRTVLTRRSCGHCTPDSGMHPARTGRGLVAHAVICFAAAACVKAATQRSVQPHKNQAKTYCCIMTPLAQPASRPAQSVPMSPDGRACDRRADVYRTPVHRARSAYRRHSPRATLLWTLRSRAPVNALLQAARHFIPRRRSRLQGLRSVVNTTAKR